jgi:hypothetical protein
LPRVPLRLGAARGGDLGVVAAPDSSLAITPRDGPYAGVEHGERGDFAAGQHLVADRDLDEAARLGYPFVDALEARGEDYEAGSRHPCASAPLRKRLAADS